MGPVAKMQPAARHAWLGVSMQPAGSAVVVSQVAATSPADRAGLRVGDRLLRVAGNAIVAPVDVQRAVAARAPGDLLVLVFERDGKEGSVRVTLAPRPSADEQARATYVGKLAPPLAGLVTVNGPPLTTDGLRNRVVILDFWAVWCVPCRLSLPALSLMQARYGAQGLSVLPITSDPAESAATFARDLGLRTPVVLDPEGTTTRAYGVSVLPTTVVIDRRGIVRDVILGYGKLEAQRLEALVATLLAEPVTPAAPAMPAPPASAGDAGAAEAGATKPKATSP